MVRGQAPADRGAGNPSPVRRGAGERCRPLDQRNAEPTAGGGEGSPHAESVHPLTLPSPSGRGFCVGVPCQPGRARGTLLPDGRRAGMRPAADRQGATEPLHLLLRRHTLIRRSAPLLPSGRREERVGASRESYPRAPNPPLSCRHSTRPRGLSRGVVRPGGVRCSWRELSRAFDHGGAVDRQGRNWAGSSPCRDVGTTRDPQITACGTGRRLTALLRHRHSTSTSARSRRLRRRLVPRIPLDTHTARNPAAISQPGLSVREPGPASGSGLGKGFSVAVHRPASQASIPLAAATPVARQPCSR